MRSPRPWPKTGPARIVWCMGGTQHHIGNNNTRLYCIFQLALGNIGVSGGGANIFRGHDNVQGATDVGPNCHTLPGYYGLAEGAWKHWARVWDVDFDWLKARFDNSREYDARRRQDGMHTDEHARASRCRAGSTASSRTRRTSRRRTTSARSCSRAMPSTARPAERNEEGPGEARPGGHLRSRIRRTWRCMSDRKNDTYLLPSCTQFETYGSVTASNRSLQWREKIIEPLFESMPDHVILYKLAKKLGFANEMFKHIKVENDEPSIEDMLREINRGTWTIGYTGQSPERLKLHAKYRHTFNTDDAAGGGRPLRRRVLRPALALLGHAGNEASGHADPVRPEQTGGARAASSSGRARRRAQRREPAGRRRPISKGSEIKDGYPEFTCTSILKKARLVECDLTAKAPGRAERSSSDGKGRR